MQLLRKKISLKFNYRSLIKYLIVLFVTVVLFWYLFHDIPIEKVLSAIRAFDYRWIFLSVLLSIFSHLLRAYRWTLLLKVSHHKPSTQNAFYAVMIGYLANSVFPRLGEVSRCGVLHKTDRIPVAISLGTVVTERIIDLTVLLLIGAFTFLWQFEVLQPYLIKGQEKIGNLIAAQWPFLAIGITLFLIIIYVIFFFAKARQSVFLDKVRYFLRQFAVGIGSIIKMKQHLQFWSATLGIWVMYFLMMYVITFGSEVTENLGMAASFAILVMGSFGMASPTPNGLATFHAFVAGVLVLYGIPREDGIIFATIMHSSQFVAVIVIGLISFVMIHFITRHKNIENCTENKVERRG